MKKRVLLLAGLVLALAGCGGGTTEVPIPAPDTEEPVGEVVITDAPETLAPGEMYKIKVETTDVDEETEVVMASSDESVATIDEEGVITAVADGTTTISVAAGEVSDEVELAVSSVLPNARTVLTNVINTRNYTIEVERSDAEFATLKYTENAINLDDVRGNSQKFALSEVDGIAFEYDVVDGEVVAGEQVADLDGLITEKTFHGNGENIYYSPIVGLGNLSIENIDEEGEDNVYTLTLWNTASDRDTYNRYLLAFIANFNDHQMQTCSPTSASITVTGFYSFEAVVVARALTGDTTVYTHNLKITNLTTTTIDDGIDEFVKTNTGTTRNLPESLLGAFEQLQTYNNYVMHNGWNYTYTLTENYCLFEITDDYVGYIVNGSYPGYSPDSTGLIKLSDGIYEITQSATVENATVVRGDVVIGDKVEGTDASSYLPEVASYLSTWKALQDPYVYVDTANFMFTVMGWTTGNEDLAQDSLDKAYALIPTWGFNPYGASDGLYNGYRTMVDASGWSSNPEESSILVYVGYQITSTQKGLSAGYSYSGFYVEDFGVASNAAVEALLE